MRIQWKFSLVVLAVLIATTAAIVWRTRAMLIEDKSQFIANASMNQILPVKRLVQERLESERAQLVAFAAKRIAIGAGRARGFGRFEIVSLVQPSEAGQWTPTWVEKSPQASADRWPAGHELTLLKSFAYGKIQDGETLWLRVSDRKGAPAYAVLFSVEMRGQVSGPVDSEAALPEDTFYSVPGATKGQKAVLVGLASANPLAAIAEDYIGSLSSVYLVNDRGYVASHTNKGYLGTLFEDDGIAHEIMQAKKTGASGRYTDLEGRRVIGHYERIERTNLYAAIATPQQAAFEIASQHTRTVGVIGLLALLVGVGGAWFVGSGVSKSILQAIRAIQAINRGDPNISVQPLSSDDEIGALTRLLAESSPAALASKASWISHGADDSGESTNTRVRSATPTGTPSPDRLAEERRAAFDTFNEGFSGAMTEPLNAILGHAQLAAAKAEGEDVRGHADSIEREARKAKSVLERLKSWETTTPGVTEQPEGKVDLTATIEAALAEKKDLLLAEHIEVVKEFLPVPSVRGSEEALRSSVGHLIDNACEAMKGRSVRQLKIQLEFLSDSIYLIFMDTGVGMSRDVKQKAFDPFFKAFESPKRMGLGLAFVRATLSSIGATATIESTPGEGAVITMKFQVNAQDKAAFFEADGPSPQHEIEVEAPAPLAAKDAPPQQLPPIMEEVEIVSEPEEPGEITASGAVPPPIPPKKTPPREIAVDIDFSEITNAAASVIPPEETSLTPIPPPLPPAGASVVRPPVEAQVAAAPEEEEEDDMFFTNPARRALAEQEETPEAEDDGQFRVKIRRPKRGV